MIAELSRTAADVAALADELHAARRRREPVAPLTERGGGLTLNDAYAVQAVGLERRLADGERVVGGKLGFTSAAMRRAMGVEQPNYGWLTDAMVAPPVDGVADIDLGTLIHPKVEPEIGFVLADELCGPDVGAADVLAATAALVPCLEVVDSRYRDFRFAAADNIADNSSAGRVVFGEPVEPGALDPRLVGCVLGVDGSTVATAAGAAVEPDPASAVAWFVNHCGRTVPAGSFVISGGLTAPVTLAEGMTVRLELDRLGAVGLLAVRPQPRPTH